MLFARIHLPLNGKAFVNAISLKDCVFKLTVKSKFEADKFSNYLPKRKQGAQWAPALLSLYIGVNRLCAVKDLLVFY